ncbi:GntR family transcriptional regulator [Bradyrhizobium sp.]|jgi:DNA-binding GntR family transcriptional regulator|uniref:GntR family transcriptional regulator n=1 Tax=Bradyrhizobium sp. TaxID=376 RepID=UPI003C1ED46D
MRTNLLESRRRASVIPSKQGEIYDLLVQRLVSARYAFGERILVRELAAEFGVSRQPIMTALNWLAADGFVRIVPQVGCQVISPNRNAIADFFLMFQRMEGLLAELAAARRTDQQLADLRELQRQIVSMANDQEALREHYAELNRKFHQTVAAMADSALVEEKQSANFNMSDFFINHAIGFDTLGAGVAQEHEPIIDAIARREPSGARRAAEEHIASVAAAVLAMTERRSIKLA